MGSLFIIFLVCVIVAIYLWISVPPDKYNSFDTTPVSYYDQYDEKDKPYYGFISDGINYYKQIKEDRLYRKIRPDIDYTGKLEEIAKVFYKYPTVNKRNSTRYYIEGYSKHLGNQTNQYTPLFKNLIDSHDDGFEFTFDGFRFICHRHRCYSEGCCYGCSVGRCGSYYILPFKLLNKN